MVFSEMCQNFIPRGVIRRMETRFVTGIRLGPITFKSRLTGSRSKPQH